MTDENVKVEDKISTTKKVDSIKKESTEKGIMVYCGPSIKGVVRQYDHFCNGLPKNLKEYAEGHKAVERLIVPVENFVEAKKNIAIVGTVENVSYTAIQEGE